MYSDREILYFLQTIPGIGNKTIRQLWHYFSSGDAVFNAVESDLKAQKEQEVKEYFEEAGTDIAGMSDEDILDASEVFALPSGRFLIVEG